MKNTSSRLSARVALSTLLVLASLALLCAIPLVKNSRAQNPASGTVTPTSNAVWTGTLVSPGGAIQENLCQDGVNCENYSLQVNGTVTAWAGKKLQIQLTWNDGAGNNASEYDLYIHDVNGNLIGSAIQGPGGSSQTVTIDPNSLTLPAALRVHVAYATTPNTATSHYTGTASAIAAAGGGGGGGGSAVAPPAPADNNGAVGYENYEAPGILTPVVVTSSGGATVEYMGRNSGEPSIGVNWKSASNSAVGGTVNFQSDLETLFISFVDPLTSPLTTPIATWVNRRAPSSVAIDSDPIGFTDHTTGRVFASELTLLSPDTSKNSFSDNDGLSWTFDPQSQGPASAVDHQTFGGGPYHTPLPSNLPGIYPHAVYYCSQDIAAAFCARSDDGGVTLGTQTPLYNLTQCGGLHGHVKVAPDGTVYVPNRSCGGNTAVVVSTDNGLSWTVRNVTNATLPATPSTDDPAVAIDGGGTVYTLFSYNGNQATVGVSTDQGQTWTNMFDVGAGLGLKNVAFPAATAGDAGRAAVAFYGSTTDAGDSSADTFPGVWHLYVAHTFDGGAHWTTTDVTPSLPMQRMGLLRGGGGPVDRNLLDFFGIEVDKDGRVLVGYVNGCAGGPCSQAAPSATGNDYSATATIARQSSGRRLFKANDPASATSAPGMPFVTETRVGNVVKLAWNEADTGNLPITGYDIYRGINSGSETLVASIGNVASYADNGATDLSQTYFYQVVAKNSVGSSPRRNEITAAYVGDTCSGLIIHRNLPSHPESTGGTASQPPTPQLLIDYVAVGEPPSTNQLMFKMKVGNLTTIPPNSRWRMVWDYVGTAANPNPDEQFFVGMRSDANSAVTYEYGTLSTLSAVVVGVPQEKFVNFAGSGSNYNADGTITIFVPKSGVGSPQPGDILGAVNGRTFTGDTPQTNTLERSTALIDHTFVKGNLDAAFPAATYTVTGGTICPSGNLVPVSAVSRKTHGSAGTFDVDLPLIGTPGIEDRVTNGQPGKHTVVVTFSVPITSLSGVSVTPGASGTADQPTFSLNNTQVTVNLTGVSNAQTLTLNLLGINGVSGNTAAIPMSVLVGDVNASGRTDNGDAIVVRNASGSVPDLSNFRADVNASGRIDNGDAIVIRNNSGAALP